MQLFADDTTYSPDWLQRFAMGLMAVLTLVTFVGTNMQALLWQSSDWLVSTVLPAVVVDLTNDERSDLQALPLVRNPVLDEAARQKAEHMAQNEYFAHYAPDGTTPWSFFRDSGYLFAHAGENLAIHFTDSTEVVDAWMNSPAHRQNIVDPKYTEIGVGTARGTYDGYDTVYVVQFFGTPAIAPTPVLPAASEPELPVSEVEVATAAEVAGAADSSALALELAALQAQIEELGQVIDSTQTQAQDSDAVDATENAPADEFESTEATEVVEVVTVETEQSAAQQVSISNDTVVVSTELATSSGLAVASVVEPAVTHAGATVFSVATQPNTLLQAVYTGVVALIILLLTWSLIAEARRLHITQVAYSLALLLMIGGLWYVHTILTSGAVIA